MSYQARLLAQRQQRLRTYLVTTTDAAPVAQWAYVRVEPARERVFLQAIQHPPCVLADYGEVLEAGFGLAPPSHITWGIEALLENN